jgi:seryl-tRNA synthetase
MELGTILAHHKAAQPPAGGDVCKEAVERRWILPLTAGQYIYTSKWVALFRRLQCLIVERAKHELGFEEWIFPRLIPRQALDSFQLTQYRNDLLFYVGENGGRALDPVQCISFYDYLREKQIDSHILPLRIVECLGGWTWRNEKLEDLDGPVRSLEFARVEHVYLGTPEQVRHARRSVRNGLTSFLSELEISWQVVSAEGCMEIPSIVEAQRSATQDDEVPVQDIEIPLSASMPQNLSRPQWSEEFDHAFDLREISGCSVEGDHLTKSFNIRNANGESLWSGCCGIGLNRLMMGFLYQHGFDESRWPDIVRREVT